MVPYEYAPNNFYARYIMTLPANKGRVVSKEDRVRDRSCEEVQKVIEGDKFDGCMEV